MSRVRVFLDPLLLTISLLLLNVVVGIHRWLPEPRLLILLAPTAETAVVAGILFFTAMRPTRTKRWFAWLLATVVTVLVLFGIGEGFYQAIYRKGFVPWTDLSFLPALLNMVLNSRAFDSPLLAALPVAALGALVTASLYLLIRWIESLMRVAPPIGVAAVACLLLALAIPVVLSGFRVPLIARAAAQLTPPANQLYVPEETVLGEEPVPVTSDEHYAFPGLKDRDIHLLIVESYGRTLLSNEAHRPLILPVYRELEKRFVDAGYTVYSGFLTSPAYGGRSWLADSTLLTGIFVETQHVYDEIVDSAAPNLTHLLGNAGYHRVLAAPGTYEADESWRSFYEFDDYLLRYDFGYTGPFISFGAMPDQYLMYRTHLRLAEIAAPIFANYVLVSSHVPFDRLPRYVDDWETLGDGSIFNELDLRLFDNNWLSGGEYPEGYVASIEYTLTSATAYITEIVADESLYFVVGDHQPRVPISEPDSSFSVPIHVISRDHELVSRFADFGLTPGLIPEQPLPHPGMDEFLTMLLTVAREQIN